MKTSISISSHSNKPGIVGENQGLLGGWFGFSGALIAPALLLFILFLLWPALAAFKVAFESWTGYSPEGTFNGTKNFELMIEDKTFWYGMKNSIIWMILGGLGHFAFAFLIAGALHSPRLKAKKFFQTLIIFPMFISAIGVAMLWNQLFDSENGMINLMGSLFGLTDPANSSPSWLTTENGIYPLLIVSIWGGIGGQIILILAGLKRIPRSLYEAAYVDGASEMYCFMKISLPLMRDIIKVAVVLWIIGSLQVFGLVQGLLGPVLDDKLHVVSTYIYAVAFNNRYNIYIMGQATLMALTLVFVTLLIIGVILLLYRAIFGNEKLEY